MTFLFISVFSSFTFVVAQLRVQRKVNFMNKNDMLLRPANLAKKLNVNLVTLWRWRRQGKIPQPINLGGRLIAWRKSTIEDWLSEKENS